MSMKRNTLAVAIFAAVVVTTGCGGGGGNTRPDAPPPATTPPNNPPTTTPPNTSRYTGPADNHIVPTNADRANAAGFTGTGVSIGLLDSGVNRSLASLNGAVASYTNYLTTDANTAIDDVVGHGSVAAQVAAGRQVTGFRGGVAPGATLHVARVCRDSDGLCLGNPVITQATRDMLARGVRIFTQSFSGQVFAAGQNLQPTYDNIVTPEGIAANALFIWSTGNQSAAQPSSIAALPTQFSNLSRNWIAVTSGSVNAQGQVDRLNDFANQCGVSAQWCLTAPGVVQILPTGGRIGGSGSAGGTSFAAPQVAGAAALVQQAFPWMGGDLLQLSLLTTARDLGAPGVDAMYGWGLLDVERAVRGPGQFAFGDVTANVDRAGSWTWANDIGGAGGLIKEGIGTLVLTGNNTYTGATRVNGGVLALNGGTVNSNVTVGSGGTFESRGGRIQGNYTAQAGSTTGLQIGGPLEITGTATLAGTANILAPRDGYSIGGTETLLNAGSIAGQFDRVTFQSGLMFDGTLSYTANRVSVGLVRKSAAKVTASLGGTGSALGGAEAFDVALAAADRGGASRDFLRASNELLTLNSAEGALIGMQSLSGEIHGTARNALLATSDQVNRAIGSRLDGLEYAGAAGGWLSVTSAGGDLEQSGFATADTEGTTLLAGVDGQFGRFTLGALAGVGNVDVSLDGLGGSLEADRSLIGVYGRTTLGKGYLLGSLTNEWLDVDTRRVGGSDTLSANRDDTVLQARIEAGVTGPISPYAALRFASYKQGSFTEAGGPFGFRAGSDTQDAVYGEVGLRYTNEFSLAGGDAWLSGHVRYQRLLSNEGTEFRASFAGIEAPFSARGQNLRKDMGLVGLTFGHQFADGWTWFADAEAEVSSGGVTGHRVSAGVRADF